MSATYYDQNFYGAYLKTSKSLSFTYGYIEMSAKLPDGDGIWTDLWTWSDKKEHLEFDITECWGPGTGYADVFVFSKMFKRQYGVSPSKYCALHGKKN